MHADYFAVPNLLVLRDRKSHRPLLRFVVLLAMAIFCLGVDALLVVLAYKAVVTLVTLYSPQTLAQVGLALLLVTGVAARALGVRRAARAANGGTARPIPLAGPELPVRDAGT